MYEAEGLNLPSLTEASHSICINCIYFSAEGHVWYYKRFVIYWNYSILVRRTLDFEMDSERYIASSIRRKE